MELKFKLHLRYEYFLLARLYLLRVNFEVKKCMSMREFYVYEKFHTSSGVKPLQTSHLEEAWVQ